MRVKTPDGKIAEFPDGTDTGAIERALRAQFPATATTVKTEPIKEGATAGSPFSNIALGAVKDTLGLGRTAADPLGRAVYDPKGWGERLILPAITAPLARGAGAGAGALAAGAGLGPVLRAIAPAVGRAGTEAAVGAVQRGARSEAKDVSKEATRGALVNGLVALGAEAVIPGLAHLPWPKFASASRTAAPLLEREAGYAAGGAKPQQALETLADRLVGITKINVPSLGGKIAPAEAMQRLVKLDGMPYQKAVAELKDVLNAVDRSGAKDRAGDLFASFVAPWRSAPKATTGEALAKSVLETSQNPALRAVTDVTATTETDKNVPAGPVAAGVAGKALGAGYEALPHRVLWGVGH